MTSRIEGKHVDDCFVKLQEHQRPPSSGGQTQTNDNDGRATSARFLLLAGGLLCAISASASAQGACLPSDSVTTMLRDAVVGLVTRYDPATITYRNEFADLPVVPDSEVTIVSDTAVCARASSALALITPNGDPNTGAWVFRVGSTRYVAFNFLQKSARSPYLVVYDTAWVRKGQLQL
jgi:hypothetical protein